MLHSASRSLNPAMVMASDLPPISVVVIGRNEGERLARCLHSIRETDYPSDKIELIYVDTDSTDDSCEVAKKKGARVIAIHPERPCAAAARNTGLRVASHNVIQFLDGDTILNSGWLKKGVASLDDTSVACVFGRVEEVAPTATIYNFWAHHDWYVAPGPAESCGGIAMFRRHVLMQENGFDESLIAGEEPDLCFRIRRHQGVTILSLGEPMTLHDINMTRFGQYWRRCIRTGHGYAEVGWRYSGMRRWRATCSRNLFYALGTPIAVTLSLGLWTPRPIAAWLVLVALAVLRNALRLRRRVGTLTAALSFSFHHYLAKTPMAIGQCSFWLRLILKRTPQSLIEYRK